MDVWMKRIMEQMYFDGRDTKKTEIEAFAVKKFGKLGGYAQQYLLIMQEQHCLSRMGLQRLNKTYFYIFLENKG